MQVDSFERNVNTQRWDNRKLTQVNMCEIFMNGYLVNYESYYLERTPFVTYKRGRWGLHHGRLQTRSEEYSGLSQASTMERFVKIVDG